MLNSPLRAPLACPRASCPAAQVSHPPPLSSSRPALCVPPNEVADVVCNGLPPVPLHAAAMPTSQIAARPPPTTTTTTHPPHPKPRLLLHGASTTTHTKQKTERDVMLSCIPPILPPHLPALASPRHPTRAASADTLHVVDESLTSTPAICRGGNGGEGKEALSNRLPYCLKRDKRAWACSASRSLAASMTPRHKRAAFGTTTPSSSKRLRCACCG